MIPLISTIVIYSLIRPLWFRNTICEKKKKTQNNLHGWMLSHPTIPPTDSHSCTLLASPPASGSPQTIRSLAPVQATKADLEAARCGTSTTAVRQSSGAGKTAKALVQMFFLGLKWEFDGWRETHWVFIGRWNYSPLKDEGPECVCYPNANDYTAQLALSLKQIIPHFRRSKQNCS